MNCPKCNSDKVRTTDNQPLWHPTKQQCEEDSYAIGIDNMVYCDLTCDDCNYDFSSEFSIVSNYTNADNEALNIILDSLDPDSLLEKSLKKVIQTLGNVKNNSDIRREPIKKETMEYNVREVLKSVEVIESSAELTAELRKTYGTDFDMIKACVKDNMIKPEAITLIQRLAPICYKINGTVFLKGDTTGEHDFIGDGLDTQKATELFDMTQEIATGNSYSFYVSGTDYFELASAEEIIEVKKFLDSW